MKGTAEEKAFGQLARSAGIVLLAATIKDQYATEFKALAHEHFTYALLKGLNGEADGGKSGDGKITNAELKAYLDDKVPELSKKCGGEGQYPTADILGHDFPVAISAMSPFIVSALSTNRPSTNS